MSLLLIACLASCYGSGDETACWTKYTAIIEELQLMTQDMPGSKEWHLSQIYDEPKLNPEFNTDFVIKNEMVRLYQEKFAELPEC